jgi:hypothetical protein
MFAKGHGRRFWRTSKKACCGWFRSDGVMIREANAMILRLHPHVPVRTLDPILLATFGAVITGPIFTTEKRMLAAAKLLGFATVE